MPDNRFFIFGDLISNMLCGVIAALIARGVIDEGWSMLPAMAVGMILGMVAAMMLNVLILMRSFGAMEIMLPCMLGGMLSGMWMGMRASMSPIALLDVITLGLLIGITTVALCWAANARLRGKTPHG